MRVNINIEGIERKCNIVNHWDDIPQTNRCVGSYKPENHSNHYMVYTTDNNEYYCYIDPTKKPEITKIKLSNKMIEIPIEKE